MENQATRKAFTGNILIRIFIRKDEVFGVKRHLQNEGSGEGF